MATTFLSANPAPFPLNSLKAPLTDAQAAALKTWARGQPSAENTSYKGTAPNRVWHVDVLTYTDQDMIDWYNDPQGTPIPSILHQAGGMITGQNPVNNAIVGAAPVPDTINAANNVVSAAESTGQFLGKLSNPNLWVRVAEFAVGGILLAVAAASVLKGTAAGKIATGVAMPVTKIGKAVHNSAHGPFQGR